MSRRRRRNSLGPAERCLEIPPHDDDRLARFVQRQMVSTGRACSIVLDLYPASDGPPFDIRLYAQREDAAAKLSATLLALSVRWPPRGPEHSFYLNFNLLTLPPLACILSYVDEIVH